MLFVPPHNVRHMAGMWNALSEFEMLVSACCKALNKPKTLNKGGCGNEIPRKRANQETVHPNAATLLTLQQLRIYEPYKQE
jgi:hypothetical protein